MSDISIILLSVVITLIILIYNELASISITGLGIFIFIFTVVLIILDWILPKSNKLW